MQLNTKQLNSWLEEGWDFQCRDPSNEGPRDCQIEANNCAGILCWCKQGLASVDSLTLEKKPPLLKKKASNHTHDILLLIYIGSIPPKGNFASQGFFLEFCLVGLKKKIKCNKSSWEIIDMRESNPPHHPHPHPSGSGPAKSRHRDAPELGSCTPSEIACRHFQIFVEKNQPIWCIRKMSARKSSLIIFLVLFKKTCPA